MNLLQSVSLSFIILEKEYIQSAGHSTAVHGFELRLITGSEVERSTTMPHPWLLHGEYASEYLINTAAQA